MSEVFADGEPVDPKKLQSLQNQIDAISLKTDQSYNLSEKLAGDVKVLSVMHLKAGVVTFSAGLKAGLNPAIDIPLEWGAGYTTAFVTASPRLKDPKTNNIRWSISGNMGATLLHVWSEKDINTAINFHWISAGQKLV
jgi:hypothetical protein